MSVHFGSIRQLGYVVRDLDAAIDYWTTQVGVGPFFVFRQAPIRDFRYRRVPCDAKIAFALAQTGDVQIELIMPLDDIPSLYNAHLAQQGEGLQHVAYWTEDFKHLSEKAHTLGYEEVLSGYTGDPDGRFAYFIGRGHPGACVEISALSEKKQKLFKSVATASKVWDGSPETRVVPMDAAPELP